MNFLLWILVSFFGYTIKKEGENLNLSKTDARMVLDRDGINISEKIGDLKEQLADTAEGTLEKSVNVLTLGAIGKNVSDDTEFIQQAVIKALTYKVESNQVGGSTYYTGNGTVKIPAGIYGISSTVNVPKGVNIDMREAIFVAIPADKTIDCFNMELNAFRNNHLGGTFVGFNRAIAVSTNNRNTSKINFDGISTFSCQTGIDTISFELSRSTLLTVKNFLSVNTNQFIKAHCDMTHLTDGWINHTGYNGASIYNQGYTKIDNVVFVPAPTQKGARPRWIDNYSVDGEALGERGIKLEHCRFGGEAGSMPLVFNYAKADTNPDNGYCASVIDIDDCILFSSSTVDSAVIVLFDIPNRISIKNSSGIHNLSKGLVTCDSSFDSKLITTSRFISISIDSSAKGSTSFPLMDDDLHRFLMTDDTPYNAFRQTFKDGKFFKRYKAVSLDESKAKVTFKIKTQTSSASGIDQENQGVAFLASISSAIVGSYGYKAQSLYLITVTGGHDGSSVKKRLNYGLIASHAGGASFETQANITSVHWGTDYIGNKDVDLSSKEENVTIAFNGNISSSVTILPLHGIDNYS